MTNTNDSLPIRRALLSVSDKTTLIELANALRSFNVEIISTGGTAHTLRDEGIPVRDVSEITGFPEMMDGRVKTLHPHIHGGLLALRDNPGHTKSADAHGIVMIDLLVVNLYPFEATIKTPNVTLDDAIENIDIGGPAMIRSAAKNHAHVAVVTSPDAYTDIIAEIQLTGGALSLQTRRRLAVAAFQHTADYDAHIYTYLATALTQQSTSATSPTNTATATTRLPQILNLKLHKSADLRYGENPHQHGALYTTDANSTGIARAEVLHGKEMSYNNYVDADAAWQLVCDFQQPAAAIIKHTNPAGAALADTLAEAYRRALATDPVSAFGGIVSFNRIVDAETARLVTEIFTEVVIAPDYDDDALEILRAKKNLRVLRAGTPQPTVETQLKQISGGILIQDADTHRLTPADLRIVTHRQPTDTEIADLLFAWTVCKHTKSNAIVYARDLATVGVGAGQMSRIDSVRLGAERARTNNLDPAASVLASDAFFPFRDGLDAAARHGITAIIQPGGSVRDDEVIAAANEHNLAMVFTGIRHFRH
jgi:phosphoribosylaminoimidazolecarboxamide formyltransferase/IMP cyclohydrolase